MAAAGGRKRPHHDHRPTSAGVVPGVFIGICDADTDSVHVILLISDCVMYVVGRKREKKGRDESFILFYFYFFFLIFIILFLVVSEKKVP